MTEILLPWIGHYGYAALFFLLMLGIVGIPIPDEGLLLFAGYLVHTGHLQLAPALASAFLGSVCGITLSYGLGHTLGLYLIKHYGPVVRITAAKMDHVHRWFERVGKWSLTFGYFLPGIRHLTALVAGASELQFAPFTLLAYPGALLWSMTFILLGYFLGEEWTRASHQIHAYSLVAAGFVALTLLVYALWRKGKGARRAR